MPHAPVHRQKLPGIAEAVDEVLKRARPVDAERAPLDQCLGRILREDVPVPFDMPPFDRSAMDGYALAGETTDGMYSLVACIAAGESDLPTLRAGECSRIFTGAPIPPGANRVAIQEECLVKGRHVQVTKAIPPGGNIRRQGEDAHTGDVALPIGLLIDVPQIGIAASLGCSHLAVSRRPCAWILSTGNELVEPGRKLKPGQIYNSNGPQLAAQFASFGAHARTTGILGDHPGRILAQVEDAIERGADILCISGGASVGDADFTRSALEQGGFTVHFHGVDLKPGKPSLFATRGKTLAFGIPGNPVSHLAVFALLIAPAIHAQLGLPPRPKHVARMKKTWKGKIDARDRWLPACVQQEGGLVSVEFLPWKGSGNLVSCRTANAVGNIPANTISLAKGADVAYAPLSGGNFGIG